MPNPPPGSAAKPNARTGIFLANVQALLGMSFFSKAANFLYIPLVARALDPADYAKATVAAALVGFFAPAADAGITSVLSREIARHPQDTDRLLSLARRTMLLTTLLAIAGCGVMAWLLRFDTTSQWLVWWFALSLLPYPTLNSVTGLLMGRQVMAPMARVGAFVICLKVSLAWPLLQWQPSPFAFLGLEAFSGLIQTVWLLVWVKRKLPPSAPLPQAAASPINTPRKLLITSIPFLGSTLAFLVLNRIDILMLDRMAPPVQVALYAAAYRLFEVLFMLPRPVAQALFPALSALSEDKTRFDLAVQKSFWLHGQMGLFIAGAGWFAAPLTPWLLGEHYRNAVPLLRLLLLGIPVLFWCWPPSTALNAVGQQRLVFVVSLLGAAVNVCLNLLLIPRYGPTGAALANTATFAIVALFYVVAMRGVISAKVYCGSNLALSLLAPLAALLATLGLERLTGESPLLLACAFGVVHLLLAWRLLPFSAQERQKLLRFGRQ